MVGNSVGEGQKQFRLTGNTQSGGDLASVRGLGLKKKATKSGPNSSQLSWRPLDPGLERPREAD